MGSGCESSSATCVSADWGDQMSHGGPHDFIRSDGTFFHTESVLTQNEWEINGWKPVGIPDENKTKDVLKPFKIPGVDGVWQIKDGQVVTATQTVPTTTAVSGGGEGEDTSTGIPVAGTAEVPFPASTGGGGGGSSFSTNLSLQDPAALQIQQQIADQNAAADAQQLIFDILKESNAVANDAASLDLQRDQLALAERQGDRSAAIQLAQLAEQTNTRLDNRVLTLAGLKQNAQIARASITSSETIAALDRAVNIAGLAENARQFNAQERRLLASEIADAAARPGDVVKQEALIQAAQSGGSGSPISTAIGQGESAITDASLLPLQMLLDAQGQLGGADSQLAQALTNILGQAGSGAAGTITDPNVVFGAGAAPLPGAVPPATALPPATAPPPTGGTGGFQFSPEGTTNTGISGPFSGGRGDVPITESQVGLIEQNAADLFQPDESGQDFDFIVDEATSRSFVVNAGRNRIEVFRKDRFLTNWGEEGSRIGQFRFAGRTTVIDDMTMGTVTERRVVAGGIARDGEGYIYVADTFNNRIQKFQP